MADEDGVEDGFQKCREEILSERTPSGREKGVHNSVELAAYGECKNTEFVWEFRKTGFCEGGSKYRAVRLRECPLVELSMYCDYGD